MEKLIITAAICGAEVTKEQNPNVPYTVEEIVREAKSAVDVRPPKTVAVSKSAKRPSSRCAPTSSLFRRPAVLSA